MLIHEERMPDAFLPEDPHVGPSICTAGTMLWEMFVFGRLSRQICQGIVQTERGKASSEFTICLDK